jgi:hypothetical protein
MAPFLLRRVASKLASESARGIVTREAKTPA